MAQLKRKLNIDASLINPKSLTNIDREDLHYLQEQHDLVVTLEDGNLSGGFGEMIARYFGATNIKPLTSARRVNLRIMCLPKSWPNGTT